MAMRRSSCWRRLVAVGALVAASWTGGFANAGEGFYAGLALGREHVGVDYRKSAGIDVAPVSHMEAEDDASAGVNALKLSLGYRWALAERFYLSTELEAALYANERVRGFLRGTGVGDRDVWPGAWTLEKSRGVGLNARVGYAPEALDFLGAGRSIFWLRGARFIWLRGARFIWLRGARFIWLRGARFIWLPACSGSMWASRRRTATACFRGRGRRNSPGPRGLSALGWSSEARGTGSICR